MSFLNTSSSTDGQYSAGVKGALFHRCTLSIPPIVEHILFLKPFNGPCGVKQALDDRSWFPATESDITIRWITSQKQQPTRAEVEDVIGSDRLRKQRRWSED